MQHIYLSYDYNCCYLKFELWCGIVILRTNVFYPYSTIICRRMRQIRVSHLVKIPKTVEGELTDIMYYLKHRKDFNPKSKVFIKNTNTYELKNILKTSTSGQISSISYILRPIIPNNFEYKPLGDIIVKHQTGADRPVSATLNGVDLTNQQLDQNNIKKIMVSMNQQNLTTLMINGAVANPTDYDLLFDNKGFQTTNNPVITSKFSVWKPIAPDGYTAFGIVTTNSYKKPENDEIYCVSNDYIKEANLNIKPDGEDIQNQTFDFYQEAFSEQSQTQLSFWKRSLESQDLTDPINENIVNYVVAKTFVYDPELKPPNMFEILSFCLTKWRYKKVEIYLKM